MLTGLRCNEPDNCAETEWPENHQSPFKVKQSQSAEERSGFGKKPDQEPKSAQ